MVLYLTKYINVEPKQFEDIYVRLVEADWKDDEPGFPLTYKLEFLSLLAIIFNDNGFYTRSEAIIEILRKVYESRKDDALAAMKYAITYLSRAFDIWSYYAETPQEYFKVVDEIVAQDLFTEDQLTEIEFKKNRIMCDYCSVTSLHEGIKYHK